MRRHDETTVLDIEQLRDVCMEDTELMRDLVTTLIDDARTKVPLIEDALDHADATSCARLAHYVKGACANLGASSMAAILKNIERDAIAGDFGACRASLGSLSAELEKFSVEAATI